MGSKLAKLVLFVALLLAVGVLAGQPLEAASGDFSLDFIASAPYTYDHGTGGGAYDDRTIGKLNDTVEQLEGGDFNCSDVATFLLAVTVDNTASAIADGPQTIELDFSFLADTTGQSGVAVTQFMNVAVNYGPIARWDVNGDGVVDVIGDGTDEWDSGISDDGGSTATLINAGLTGPAFTPGSELVGTVILNDLEADEQVILRIDVLLECDTDPTTNPTGNLQGALTAARLTHVNGDTPVEPPDAIPGGEQTVPWKQLGGLNQLLDWGDLPDSSLGFNFPTEVIDGGPRHIFLDSGDVILGALRDAEGDGQPSPAANGDDTSSNDEDGVAALPFSWNATNGGGVAVQVTGGSGCLSGWLDINGDGDFDLPAEQIIGTASGPGQLLTEGSHEIYFSLPQNLPADVSVYSRFRLIPTDSSGGCSTIVYFGSPLTGGEVEDYAWTFTPTAVTMQAAEAMPANVQPLWLVVIAAALGLASIVTLRRRIN